MFFLSQAFSQPPVPLSSLLARAGSLSEVGEDLGQLVDHYVVGRQGRHLGGII